MSKGVVHRATARLARDAYTDYQGDVAPSTIEQQHPGPDVDASFRDANAPVTP